MTKHIAINWIKLSVNLFSSEKVKLIGAMPQGNTILCMWFQLFCLAGKKNINGWVRFNEDKPYTNKMLGKLFGESTKMVRTALKALSRVGLIEIDKNKMIRITKWAKYQNIEGLEKIRRATRERVRKCRERAKKEACLLSALPVTKGGIVKDTEKSGVSDNVTLPVTDVITAEKELDIDKEKKEKKSVTFSFKTGLFVNLDFQEAEEYQAKYPGIDVYLELEKMEIWLIAQKKLKDAGKKSKIPKNYNLFIHNWLRRRLAEEGER